MDVARVVDLYDRYVALKEQTDALKRQRNENAARVKMRSRRGKKEKKKAKKKTDGDEEEEQKQHDDHQQQQQQQDEDVMTFAELVEEGKRLKHAIGELDVQLVEAEEALQTEARRLPNMTHESVPTDGKPRMRKISAGCVGDNIAQQLVQKHYGGDADNATRERDENEVRSRVSYRVCMVFGGHESHCEAMLMLMILI